MWLVQQLKHASLVVKSDSQKVQAELTTSLAIYHVPRSVRDLKSLSARLISKAVMGTRIELGETTYQTRSRIAEISRHVGAVPTKASHIIEKRRVEERILALCINSPVPERLTERGVPPTCPQFLLIQRHQQTVERIESSLKIVVSAIYLGKFKCATKQAHLRCLKGSDTTYDEVNIQGLHDVRGNEIIKPTLRCGGERRRCEGWFGHHAFHGGDVVDSLGGAKSTPSCS